MVVINRLLRLLLFVMMYYVMPILLDFVILLYKQAYGAYISIVENNIPSKLLAFWSVSKLVSGSAMRTTLVPAR